MKKKGINFKKSYVLFRRDDKNFATVVREKSKIVTDVWMLHPLQIVKYYKDILTKTEYEEQFNHFTVPTTIFIDDEIANKIQENNVTASDVVKVINNAKEYRKSL